MGIYLQHLPKCCATTKQGAPCRNPAVKGVGRCRMHGGGKALLARYQQELPKARSAARKEWLLGRLGRAMRNKLREHIKGGPSIAIAAEHGERAAQVLAQALRDGRTNRQAVVRWTKAVEAVRPYRMEIAAPVVAEALAGAYGTAIDGAAVLADFLALGEGERRIFFRAVGVPDQALGVHLGGGGRSGDRSSDRNASA